MTNHLSRFRSVSSALTLCILAASLDPSPCAGAAQQQSFEVADRPAFVIEPSAKQRRKGPLPWIWYAPTFAGRLPGTAEEWMFSRLLDAGIAIAGVDVGESYGSPTGQKVYQSLYEELTRNRGYGLQPVLLARSRGGLMLLNWAATHPKSVAGIAGIYPVCNLESYPGLAKAAPAYGLTAAELKTRLGQHNPVDRLELLALNRIPIFHIQGDSDRVVPHERNSQLLAERYRQLNGPVEIELIAGQGHNMWRGWFESERLTQFMIQRALGRSALELASPFVEGAILQRGMPVPIWGWADVGSEVLVEFAGQLKTARADQHRRWRLLLDPLEASSKERILTVSSRGESIRCERVLVGEVWLASGQSNMDWPAERSRCRELASQLRLSPGELPVREYNVNSGSALFPQDRADSADDWKSSRQAGSFSALSLAFAWTLHQHLQVPIGIIRSSHGATPIGTWTAREGFALHETLNSTTELLLASDPTNPRFQSAINRYFTELRSWQQVSAARMDRGGPPLSRPRLPGILEDWKGASRMFNSKIHPLIPFAIRGAIWCHGTSNSNDGRIYATRMAALVDGWREAWGRPDLPFHFTQMPCYGQPDPDTVGFADLREAQTQFFLDSRHVGMVPQYDLNPANPSAIHYHNKLDPGKRLARWALAKQYGREIAYCGPIYQSHQISGNTVRVRFEQRGPGGGLMVGSKGMEQDDGKIENGYVEPARPTPDERLRHFRLAGKDRNWHAAEAFIDGNEVVVRSDRVPEPVGVQYAYMNSPIGANLCNEAGLPALPFARFENGPVFVEADSTSGSDSGTRQRNSAALVPATLFRDHAILQRNRPIPVWGHGEPGTRITVNFDGQIQQAIVTEFGQWQVMLDPVPARRQSRELTITCSNGDSRTVRDVLVGDVWFLTGTRRLDGELIRHGRDQTAPDPLAMVREFRIKTRTRRFRTPRKIRMEIGGGRFVASWQPVDFDDAGDPPSVAAYHFAAAVRETGVPLGIVTLGAENPPLTWISDNGLQTATGFEHERDGINVAIPNTEACKEAILDHEKTLVLYGQKVAALLHAGKTVPASLADSAPAFPEPFFDQWASRTETATHTYNFCISPLTPFAVRGVAWLPGPNNIGSDPTRYAAALKALADSLPETFGCGSVPLIYAHPTESLVPGIGLPDLPVAHGVHFSEWSVSSRPLASQLGETARKISR